MTTLANLVTTLRQRTDTVASEFITDSELEGYLNASLAELDDLLVGTYEDYKVTTTTATITSAVEGSNSFALPADFYKLRGVDRQLGGAPNWATLTRFQMSERNAYAAPVVRCVGGPATLYRLEGLKVWCMPAAGAIGTYRVWYVPRFVALASGASLPDHMDTQAWHEYAIADSGAKVMQKQDLDPSVFMAQKTALAERIIKAAATRDAGGPRVMVNTRELRRLPRWGMH